MNFDYLNEVIYDTITNFNINRKEDLYYYLDCMNIINNNCKSMKSTSYKIKYSEKKIKNISKSFFININIDYLEKFEKSRIYFFDKVNPIFDINNQVILLSKTKYLDGVFDLTHEFTHYLSMPNKNINDTNYLYCETLSLLSEILLSDYLKDYKESKVEMIRKYNSIFFNNEVLDVETKLILDFLKYGSVYKDSIENIFSKYSKQERIYITNYLIEFIKDNEYLDIVESSRYTTGYILAIYLYERSKINGYKEFIDLIDNMNNLEIKEFFSYLDLELEEENYIKLKKESVKKLELNYKNVLKDIG